MAINSEHYDVVIVGAGIAGSALACALCTDKAANATHSKLRIALVEARHLASGWPPCDNSIDDFDPRVSALTVASQKLFESIDVWPTIAQQRISPFNHMHVWDAEGTGEIDFDAADVRAPVLGHIVENRVTVAALLNKVREHSNIRLYDGQPVASLALNHANVKSESKSSQPQITLADGSTLSGSLIVAADGANSPLRTMADLSVREWDYQHDALVCTVKVERSHQQTAWQRFTPFGPLAFLPLFHSVADELDQTHTQRYCSIVWSQTREQTAQAMKLNDADFCAALARAFECRLGAVEACSKRFSFPLRQRHAINYVKPGFALVADAAHAIHPLAGQGINLGLADVQVLANCISEARARGQSIGDIAVLARYQRERKGDNLAMMAAVEGFKRLFEPLPLPLRWLRNAGMNVLEKNTGLKNRIIKHAMGIA